MLCVSGPVWRPSAVVAVSTPRPQYCERVCVGHRVPTAHPETPTRQTPEPSQGLRPGPLTSPAPPPRTCALQHRKYLPRPELPHAVPNHLLPGATVPTRDALEGGGGSPPPPSPGRPAYAQPLSP